MMPKPDPSPDLLAAVGRIKEAVDLSAGSSDALAVAYARTFGTWHGQLALENLIAMGLIEWREPGMALYIAEMVQRGREKMADPEPV